MQATQLRSRSRVRRVRNDAYIGAEVAPGRRRTPTVTGTTARKALPPGALPSWDELTHARPTNTIQVVEKTATETRGGYKTVKFALGMLAVVLAGTLYVGHVYSTQDALEEVRQLRQQNTVLHLEYNRVRGAFDEKTGPGQILGRARQLGLTEDYAYQPTIWKD